MSIFSVISKLFSGTALPTIDHEALVAAISSNSHLVVDVREPDEYKSGHIQSARNLPLSRFNPDQLPRSKPVVLVCRSGGRSANALKQLIATGRADASHYAAGTMGWKSRGGKMAF